MQDCDRCQNLKIEYKIRSPRDLEKAIHVISDNLHDGTLRRSDYWPKGKIRVEMPPFEEGIWGDLIIYYFECAGCGQLFSLSAETYHGSGGSWRPICRE
jgi:hypothetical protein